VGTPKPPVGLSTEAQRLFHETCQQYALDDAPSLTLLACACRSLDRLRIAEKIVEQEGAIVRDRFGQWKPHPCARRIDCEISNLQRSLRELGISLAPATNNTRPPEGI
jgi:phage terminase small subunit